MKPIKKKTGSCSEKIKLYTEIVILITAIVGLIVMIYNACPSAKQPTDGIDCSEAFEALNETQIRLRIDSDLQKRNLDSAINMLICLKKYEPAYSEESVRIIGWCIQNDTQCEYLKKATEVADRIINDKIRLIQRAKITLEKLKKDCMQN